MEESNIDCPTGILVDLPISECKFKDILSHNPEFTGQRATSIDLFPKLNLLETEESRMFTQEDAKYSDLKTFSLNEDPDVCIPKLNEVNDQLPAAKLRWKTPSPKSMSCINKEASKIIYNLNSSTLFDEDDISLNDEVLPIPINFDSFDLDDINQDDQIPDNKSVFANENEIPDNKSTVSVQTECTFVNTGIIDNEQTVNTAEFPFVKKKFLSVHLPEEMGLFQPQLKENASVLPDTGKGSQPEMNLKEINLCQKDNESSISDDESAYNFDVLNVFYSKEINEKENKVLLGGKKNSYKAEQKKIPVMKMKVKSGAILRNLSNTEHPTFNDNTTISGNAHVKVSFDLIKNCRKTKSNELSSPPRKVSNDFMKVGSKSKSTESSSNLPLHKSAKMVKPRSTSKVSRSNSFQNDRELIRLQKPNSNFQKTSISNSVCKLYEKKYDALSKMKSSFTTPSKRYSLCTPVKNSAFSVKSVCSSASKNLQHSFAPSLTAPRLVGTSCSSKLNKQLDDTLNNTQIFRHQDSSVMSPFPKAAQSLLKIQLSKEGKETVHKKTSVLSSSKTLEKNAVSAINRKRFSSKKNQPSPLPVTQSKSSARALFPSV